jgi:chloramphenicol 3-O-phosphotransferase
VATTVAAALAMSSQPSGYTRRIALINGCIAAGSTSIAVTCNATAAKINVYLGNACAPSALLSN